MTNLDITFKSRDITLLTKVSIVKATVFPSVMYICESWTTKKTERQRIHAFKLWCWRRLLRVPWTIRRCNQSILKEINPEYSFEGLMLSWSFNTLGHLMQRANSLEKYPDWRQRLKAKVIAYSEWCRIYDLQERRFSFGTRDQAWPLRALV